jgi:mitofilin
MKENALIDIHLNEMENAITEFHNEIKIKERVWDEQLKARVDEERSVRLARLEQMTLDLKYLEKVTLEASEGLIRSNHIHMLQACIVSIRQAIEDPYRTDISKEIALLKRLSNEDLFVYKILGSFPIDICSDTISSKTIKNEFMKISPLMRAVQLVPEKAGLVSYLLARVFSMFLVARHGLVPGSDVESVIARADYYLSLNDLDSATREINQVQGWSRFVVEGWLEKSRRYLELQQGLEIIEAHLVVKSLGVVE